MARPIKQGLDYFPLDVVLNTKFELIEAEYGLVGFAVVVKLFQEIYGKKGYYCEWSDEVALLFARKNVVGVNVVSEIVNASIRRGIFDERMFKKYQILTSASVQDRYLTAKRSDISKIKSEYLLLSSAVEKVNATKTEVNVTETNVNVTKSTQSKVKKSKVKESKRECIATPTLTDITDYIQSKGYCVDANRFYSYYAAKSWANVSNWKAMIDYWQLKDKEKLSAKSKNSFNNYEQRGYTEQELDDLLKNKGAL